MKTIRDNKMKMLLVSIVLDLVGLLSFSILDIFWAPISGYLMTKLYKGQPGRIAGIFSFIEEIIPGTDFIPTFTIMWFYTYVIKSQNNSSIIEV